MNSIQFALSENFSILNVWIEDEKIRLESQKGEKTITKLYLNNELVYVQLEHNCVYDSLERRIKNLDEMMIHCDDVTSSLFIKFQEFKRRFYE